MHSDTELTETTDFAELSISRLYVDTKKTSPIILFRGFYRCNALSF